MNFVFEVAAAVAIGTITAVATLIIFHYFVSPTVMFSQDVRVQLLKDRKRISYSVKLKKSGFIDLIDTQIRCAIYIRDIAKKGGLIWNSYAIPTTFPNSLRVKSGSRIIHLSLFKMDKLHKPTSVYIKEHVCASYPEYGIRFEDIFRSYNDVYLKVFFLGHDRFTGVKKLYESNNYYFHNIREGSWDGMNLNRKTS